MAIKMTKIPIKQLKNIDSIDDKINDFSINNISNTNKKIYFNNSIDNNTSFIPLFWTDNEDIQEKNIQNRLSDLERQFSVFKRQNTHSYIDTDTQIRKINQTINENLSNEIEKIEPTINEKVDEKVNEKVDKKMVLERNNIIWSLSLFVAFFTFISINITIFSKIDNLFTALLLMFGMIISIWIMLIIFFSFLYKSKMGGIFFLVLVIIVSVLGYYFKEFLVNLSLEPTNVEKIKLIEDSRIRLEEKIKYLEEENKLLKNNFDQKLQYIENVNQSLKVNLEEQISKEIYYKLLEYKYCKASN